MHNTELSVSLLDKKHDKETQLEQYNTYVAGVFPPQFKSNTLIILKLRNTLLIPTTFLQLCELQSFSLTIVSVGCCLEDKDRLTDVVSSLRFVVESDH